MYKKKSNAFTDTDYVVAPLVAPEVEADLAADLAAVKHDVCLTDGFTIEEVPVPKRAGRKAVHAFPIDQLTAGSEQSFLVRSTPEDLKKTLTRIRTFAYRNDYKVTLRTEDHGVRVWRAQVTA